MAESVPKKNKKRRHSQIDNGAILFKCALFKTARGVLVDDDEPTTKSPKLASSKPRTKPALPEIEDQSPPLSEQGSQTGPHHLIHFYFFNQMAFHLQRQERNTNFQSDQ